MKFNTETLTQVAKLLLNDWQEQGLELAEMRAAEVEQQVQRGLQEVGQQLLRGLWEAQDAHLHEKGVVCGHAECRGSKMRRVARREVQVMSIWGPVKYRRGEYACESKHRRAALDEQQGLHPGQPTPQMELLLGLSGAEMSFEQGAEWVHTWLQVEVSPNTVRRATQTLGERQERMEQSWYAESESQDHQRAHREARTERSQRMYASLDGGFVPVRKGQNGEEDWREAKLVAWYQEGQAYGETEKRVQQIELYGTLGEKEAFGELFWASGYHYGADLAEEVVIVADGAAWIWNLAQTYFPHAVQILDWTHAVEYLHAIRRDWNPQDEETGEQWLIDNKALLWHGEVARVILQCRMLASAHGPTAKAAAAAATYFARNIRRMSYDYFREHGYFIGSGTIESGVKRLISARMKISGARWNMASGEKVLKARSAYLNRSWHQLPLAA